MREPNMIIKRTKIDIHYVYFELLVYVVRNHICRNTSSDPSGLRSFGGPRHPGVVYASENSVLSITTKNSLVRAVKLSHSNLLYS